MKVVEEVFSDTNKIIFRRFEDDTYDYYFYNEEGHCTYRKISTGAEIWYDNHGNYIHIKNKICESWHEYNDMDLPIHYKDSNNSEWWKEYDCAGNLIYLKREGKEFFFNGDRRLILERKYE